MSYILDALKKSDEERQSNRGPTIQTIQRPVKSVRNNSTLIIAVVASLSIVALAVVAGYLLLRQAPQPINTVSQDKSQTPAQPDRPPVTAPVDNPAGDQAGAHSDNAPTVAFSELPDNIRNDIPALTFSFHVYSQNPASRTIIINNRRVKEGDEVLRHLRLLEITREGVVLQWKGRRFFINVVENW